MALSQCGKCTNETAPLLKNIGVTEVFVYCTLKQNGQTGNIVDCESLLESTAQAKLCMENECV